jgi:NifU-like protein involved in Fe-S cluster formation
VGSPGHGDVLQLSLKLSDGKVSEARFKSFGCAVAIAAGSVTTELIRGMRLEELENFGNSEVAKALGGVPESKMECSVLVEQALREFVRRRRAEGSGRSSREYSDEPHRGNAANPAAGASPRG